MNEFEVFVNFMDYLEILICLMFTVLPMVILVGITLYGKLEERHEKRKDITYEIKGVTLNEEIMYEKKD